MNESLLEIAGSAFSDVKSLVFSAAPKFGSLPAACGTLCGLMFATCLLGGDFRPH
jgi:hypothetical protein